MVTTTLEGQGRGDVARREHTRGRPHYRPNVDILETPDELRVVADVPGTTPDGIDVNFENGTLTIHAEVEPRQEDGMNFFVREYGAGDYYRAFEISEAIDAERISAEYADGVLTLRMPKAEAARARKIEVKSAK